MSNELPHLPLPWSVGQLHPSMRALGCEHLYAVFSANDQNVKFTVAENLTKTDATFIVAASNTHQALLQYLRDTIQHLEEVMRNYDPKNPVAEDFYSTTVGLYHKAHQLLATFDTQEKKTENSDPLDHYLRNEDMLEAYVNSIL